MDFVQKIEQKNFIQNVQKKEFVQKIEQKNFIQNVQKKGFVQKIERKEFVQKLCGAVIYREGGSGEPYVTQSYNAETTQNIVLADNLVNGLFVEYVCKSASYAQEGILRVVQFDDIVKYHESFESLQNEDMNIELSVYIAGGEIRLQLINNTGENIIFTYKKELKR